MPHEQVIAAWPVARTISETFRIFRCALALARGLGIVSDALPGMSGFPLPRSIATALRPTTGLTFSSRAILP